ncbi:MAG: hypothetical protein ACR2PG_26960 [Hyphomicrobiaceae bacterium]
MHDALEKRIPSLMDSATRVHGPEACLFGIDLGLKDFNALCDEVGVHEYERNEGLLHDGLKIQPNTTLEPGEINAVVFVPNQLIIRKTTLEPPR